MDFSLFSPESIGYGVASVLGLASLAHAFSRGRDAPMATTASAATVPASDAVPVTPPTQPTAVVPYPGPLPDALAVPAIANATVAVVDAAAGAAGTVAGALVGVAAAVIAVGFTMAISAAESIVVVMGEAALDVAPLSSHYPGPKRVRIRCGHNRNLTSMSPRGAYRYLRDIWIDARAVGSSSKTFGFHRLTQANDPWSLAMAEDKAVERLRRVFHVIRPHDRRFMNRPPSPGSVAPFPLFTREFVYTRMQALSGKQNDKYWESRNIRSDTAWVMDYFVLWYFVAWEYGCDDVQALYISASMTLDVVFVWAGINPGTGMVGHAPEDYGFVIPHALPATFQRRN